MCWALSAPHRPSSTTAIGLQSSPLGCKIDLPHRTRARRPISTSHCRSSSFDGRLPKAGLGTPSIIEIAVGAVGWRSSSSKAAILTRVFCRPDKVHHSIMRQVTIVYNDDFELSLEALTSILKLCNSLPDTHASVWGTAVEIASRLVHCGANASLKDRATQIRQC